MHSEEQGVEQEQAHGGGSFKGGGQTHASKYGEKINQSIKRIRMEAVKSNIVHKDVNVSKCNFISGTLPFKSIETEL